MQLAIVVTFDLSLFWKQSVAVGSFERARSYRVMVKRGDGVFGGS